MIVVATWPLLISLQRRLAGRRTVAIAIMMIAMLLVFVLPFWVVISTLADYSDEVGTVDQVAAARGDSGRLRHSSRAYPP